MDMLLKEMQEMDRIVQQPVMGPKVNEVIQDTVNPVAMPLDVSSDSSFAEVSCGVNELLCSGDCR